MRHVALLLLGTCVAILVSASQAAEVITIAGTGVAGFTGDGGPALKAELNNPFGMEIAPDGLLYFCDFSNHAIRRIDLKSKIISTLAGTSGKPGFAGDGGPAASAAFHEPHELRFDMNGHCYISDTRNHVIRKLDGKTLTISTVAGTGMAGFQGDESPATQALLNLPIAVSMDAETGLLICDIKNHRIRRVDLATGGISTFAGTGEPSPAIDGAGVLQTPLFGPRSLALDSNQDLIVVLREGNAVYRINRKTMTLHHLAGTGKTGYSGDGGEASVAAVAGPKGVAVDREGNVLLCDTENHVIRVIYKSTGIIDTLIGDGKQGDGPDGDPKTCRLNRPHGVFVDKEGTIYIGDSGNHKIRRLVR